jgi:uncharacterized surface protein with fasciclin (FAS1) repeats
VTVFVPSGETVKNLGDADEDGLSSLLRGHMLGRAVTEAELRTAERLMTLEKTDIRISRDGATTRVGEARIVRGDIQCTNGVVHVIDGVLGQ